MKESAKQMQHQEMQKTDLVITNYKYSHDTKFKSVTDIIIKQELRFCQKNIT
jgi:hypothetical protein